MHQDKKSFRILGVIPARYNSSRFPGKPLVMIDGKTMLRRVFDQCCKSKLSDTIIATDDERILEEVNSWNLNVKCILTSDQHNSGTDRMFEAIEKYSDVFDGYINVQGDEPFVEPRTIDSIINTMEVYQDLRVIITIVEELLPIEFRNRNVVKALVDADNNISSFFRSCVYRKNPNIFRHVGIYGMTHSVMEEVKYLKPTENENIDKLEQLRWLDNGILIFCDKSDTKSISIDTPEDLAKI